MSNIKELIGGMFALIIGIMMLSSLKTDFANQLVSQFIMLGGITVAIGIIILVQSILDN